MMPDLLPVFLNGHQHPVPPGTTLRQLLDAADPALGAAMADGSARATDGRGVAVSADQVLVAGSILRVFRSARHDGGPGDG